MVVPRLLSRLTAPIRGLHEAAYVLAILALMSQLLALVRDRLLAGTFGASPTLDLYYAAFRIPDFLFATVASLLSLYALMPVLSRLEEESPGKMLSFLRQMLGAFFIGMGIIGAVAFIFAPQIARVVAPGLATDPEAFAHLVTLTRILLLQPILLGASNMLANLTQLRHRFALYAVSPLLYNLGIILGVLLFYPKMGIVGLAWGVVLGAFLHACIQLPHFFAEKVDEHLPGKQTLRELRQVLMLSVPRTLALASTQISLIALTALASYLAAGSISIFTFAYNLQAVPIAIIGVSYSVAAFPTLARLHARGEHEELMRHIETALRHLLFWSIPVIVLAIVLRAELVRVILGQGHFDWSATRLTAAAFALFISALVAQNVNLLIARTYYAAGNSLKPLFYGLIDVCTSIGSAVLLAGLFHTSADVRAFMEALLRVDDVPGTTILMLALGYALGSIAKALVGYLFFIRDFGIPQRRIVKLALHSFGASLVGGVAAYATLALLGGAAPPTTVFRVFLTGLMGGLVGIVVTALILALLKNEELTEIYRTLKHKILARPVALEPTDIES